MTDGRNIILAGSHHDPSPQAGAGEHRQAGEEARHTGGVGQVLDGHLVGAVIELPFPPSELSGHNNGQWFNKSGIVAKHRKWAFTATKAARPTVPAKGDVRLHIHFHAPDNRGDRTNYWNRCKPYIDGIAEALGINDRRFLPSKSFGANEPGGRVLISIGASA